jgi:tripartite-type tricarboxylate transporter receptor subunit TctC
MNHFAPAVSVALLCVAIPNIVLAQDYPLRPIRMISPNAAGSSNDVLGRILAQKLGEALGQQIVVENRAGAGGAIGMEAAKAAAPDGYTLLAAATAPMSIVPNLRSKLPYDPLKDYAFISTFAITPNALVVNPGLPIHSMRELIDYAKARGAQVNMASAGQGSQGHLAGELLMQMAGMQSLHVPYKGGGPSVVAVMTNESQWTVTPAPGVMSFLKQNRLRLIAHSLPERSALFPGIPTISETVPGYTFSGWAGLLAPILTPQPIIDKLRAKITSVAATQGFTDLIAAQGAVVRTSTPEEFRSMVASELDAMARTIKSANIKIE